jgi:hypothetical protein
VLALLPPLSLTFPVPKPTPFSRTRLDAPPDPGGPAALAAWCELGGKLHERLAGMVTAHMTACPLPFGPLVPHFLGLFVGSALVAADADALRAMRAKRRVLLVRFIAKALLCPYYRAEWLEVNVNVLNAGGRACMRSGSGGSVPGG